MELDRTRPLPARRSRGGRPPSDDPKEQRINLRCSMTEVIELQARADAAGLTLATFVRRAALGRSIHAVPVVQNLPAWQELARAAGNLNQLAKAAHAGRLPIAEDLIELRRAMDELRAQIMGTADDPEDH